MGLKHIIARNLEPEDEHRALLLLRIDNHRQLGCITQKLYSPNSSREVKKRLEIDRYRKEIALSAIDDRLAELVVMLGGRLIIQKAVPAEGSA
ncbi:MAG: hypothetical protein A2846_04740 [Candidatus Doudnabacteria bacterium RIFCSPHIGHO2_01_FULL_49_9]|uniref:Uncharacterized protein n=1 Tax=Candidatus Doudnabacteria bacterium RIFCSPHIGHO2_01_FULL_49_9 TaxID=1817827 RepID=A0A1F5P1Q7_9BACT|nr:MAG: hypothetical protein A2846_04740 [Candidatus Doudnabacteria bacterium RIFCSPHIGHO2_01_FULL_49_9]